MSVVVATRDRAALLDDCLSHLAVQDVPRAEFEVIVVDNGSSDDTPAVVARWMRRSTVFRSHLEPSPGLSIARNAGLAAARAPFVAFVDDDARVARGWLRALIDAYARHPELVALGGRVDLALLRDRPRWLTPAVESWYSALDLGDAPLVVAAPLTVSGANMSFRRQALVDIGGFPTSLGRVGSSLLSNEETYVVTRLREEGGAVGYEPLARAAHVVQPERLRLRWILARTLAQGRSDFLEERERGVVDSRRSIVRAAGRSIWRGFLVGWRSDVRRLRAGETPAGLGDSLARRARDLGYAGAAARALR